jgi:hypothetical protein
VSLLFVRACATIILPLQWLAHGGNGSTDLIELAQDYLAHNISVGALDVDSTYALM